MIPIITFVVLALFFLIFMRGYNYICYALLFAAFLVSAYSFFPVWLRKLVSVLTVLGLVWFCFTEYFVINNCRTDKSPGRSYIVVLGASVRGDEPSLSLLHRLQAAYAYLAENENAVAVVSGGQGPGEIMTEAACMKKWLMEKGIDGSRILEEGKSTSTSENLSFSKEIILSHGGSLDDVAVLSSPYHLYRAKYMAEAMGYSNVAGVACVYGYPIFTVGMFIREAFGVTHMWIFGD